MGFSRREYWSGLLFSSPGDLPDPGVEPGYPALQADSLTTELQGTPTKYICIGIYLYLIISIVYKLLKDWKLVCLIIFLESEEELKRLLMKLKEESETAGLKLNFQKSKIMASSPITPWQIDGETMETVTDFIFLGSKITADGDYSHEIKRHLLLGRKAVTNLDSILKSKDIALPMKAHLVKAMVFPVVMYGCERWTLKKVEC